ncbi:hypothetical protein Q3G72_000665 [Acer saccharum]|nr:hypothetical protein Q3G72_000665 [Acer saccharum]
MKRAAAGATEPVMKRVRNGATEPVMTEREMDRVTDRVMVRVMDLEQVMKREMQEIKRLIETLSKYSAAADCNGNPRTSLDQVETSEGRGYQLLFANKLPSTIFTDSKIEAEIGGPVKIVLIDTISTAPVTSGPLSSIKIQILVLDGDFGFEAQENWTEQDFNDKVVHGRDGKRPLVTGELNIMLRDGVGIISDLSFTNNSSWIKYRKFRLGARVVQSIGGHVRIKEAISEAFVVKDHRTKRYGKHHPPSLDDEVWRLEKIRKDGKFHRWLASHQIDTVKDFMRMYVTYPTKLREMLDCPEGAWNTIVEHASTCDVNNEIFYTYSVEGIGLLFNSVYKLVAATFDGQNYQFLDDPTFTHKPLVETIKKQAYRNVNSFVPVDGHATLRLVTLPESTDSSSKVVRLLYTNSGAGILALGSSGIQKLWKWPRNDQNPSGKATASVIRQHWLPNSGLIMTNDISGVNLEEAVPCIALSKNDSYVMSATGGKVSLFNMMTFKVMTTFMPPPPASTFLAFQPQDNNIIAIGMEDSTIHIYNVREDEVKSILDGHHKRITGLAFSSNLNILVSSGADAQLSVWSIDTWEKRKSVAIQIPVGKAPNGDTRVHFHSDQIRMLVVHETQLAIYDASKMEVICQWVPQDVLSAPISCATYSCNSQLVYATFCDGNIGVFDADTLRLRCHIYPTAYLSQAVLNGSQAVYPLVVAAHPLESNQFAVGLTDGTVKVLEPSEPKGKWGVSPPGDNRMLNGRTTSSSTSNQPHTRPITKMRQLLVSKLDC